MKVLLLVQKCQKAILDRLYEGIAANSDCDTRWLTDEEQANLKRYFREYVDTARYDRIVLFLRFKKEIKQVAFISTIPNLVILEHDACQNYMSASKYKGKFSAHYRAMPWARVIVSGYQLSNKLSEEGFDAVFVPKGYDQKLLWNEQKPRDIELGFVGGVNNKIYVDRATFLNVLAAQEPLRILQTNPGGEYREVLNRIRYFVCPDLGIGEYMLKTFEAMACGCTVLAYDQGSPENKVLGFEHMKNLVLFKTLEDLRLSLQLLRESQDLALKIAEQGCSLVTNRYRFEDLGRQIIHAMVPELRTPVPDSFGRLRTFFKAF
jgi:glycosyltransferase involved in cell wall biosynthesis